MDELPEFLRRLLPVEHTMPDEDAKSDLSVEAAREIVAGPSLSAVVESNTPLPVIPAPINKLAKLSDQALDKLSEILGMSRDEVINHPQFERLIAWAKLQLNASEVTLRSQIRVDENILKARAVDTWPKLRERLEKARIEARQLREERLGAAKVVEGGTR